MKYPMIIAFAALGACAPPPDAAPAAPAAPPVAAAVASAPPPPRSARTADQFDTTTAAQRRAATQVATTGAEIGTTIATLGAPTEPGIWLKTPLVAAVIAGRIAYQGRTINIELRPSGGVAGSGSQISLAAMRLIDAPLTGLVPLTVLR